jgi:hypothetical protein
MYVTLSGRILVLLGCSALLTKDLATAAAAAAEWLFQQGAQEQDATADSAATLLHSCA